MFDREKEVTRGPDRPGSVSWLAVGVLVLAAGNVIRFFTGLSRYSFLKELGLSAPPAYLIAGGGFWGLAGLGLAAGLWWGVPRAAPLTLAAALLYSFQFWFDRLVLATSSTANLNWPFAAVMNVLALAMIWFILSRPGARRYFGCGSSNA